jgi:hypothetical protein
MIVHSRVNAVGTATGYRMDGQGVGVRVPVSTSSSTQILIQWGYLGLFRRGRVVKLMTNLPLVPRSRKRASIHPLNRTSSWNSSKLVSRRVNFKLTRLYNRENTRERVLSECDMSAEERRTYRIAMETSPRAVCSRLRSDPSIRYNRGNTGRKKQVIKRLK